MLGAGVPPGNPEVLLYRVDDVVIRAPGGFFRCTVGIGQNEGRLLLDHDDIEGFAGDPLCLDYADQLRPLSATQVGDDR